MQIKQVSMTPEWASQILKQNTHNRSCRSTLIAQIAHDICAGRWLLTPQTCSIATDGTLLDGQHRLMAIVKSGQTVPLMLATECPPEVFTAIDTGVSRTAGDLLRIDGIANYNNVAALIRAVTLYKYAPHVVWSGSCYPLSKQAVVDTYKNDPSGWDKSVAYYKVSKACKFAHPTAIAAFHYLYFKKSTELGCLASDYIHQFITGEQLSYGSPILAIRNYMANNYSARTGRQGQFQIACHIKAFSYWRDDCELKLFKVPTIVPMPML